MQMKNRFTRNALDFFWLRFINTWMAYLLILWTLSLSSDKIPYSLRNFHAFESQDPRTKKFGLDSIAYRASQLWKNIPEEIRSSPSLLIFKESIKKSLSFSVRVTVVKLTYIAWVIFSLFKFSWIYLSTSCSLDSE